MATPDDFDETSGSERAVMTGRVGLGLVGLGRVGAIAESDASGAFVAQSDQEPDVPSTWTEVDL